MTEYSYKLNRGSIHKCSTSCHRCGRLIAPSEDCIIRCSCDENRGGAFFCLECGRHEVAAQEGKKKRPSISLPFSVQARCKTYPGNDQWNTIARCYNPDAAKILRGWYITDAQPGWEYRVVQTGESDAESDDTMLIRIEEDVE